MTTTIDDLNKLIDHVNDGGSLTMSVIDDDGKTHEIAELKDVTVSMGGEPEPFSVEDYQEFIKGIKSWTLKAPALGVE